MGLDELWRAVDALHEEAHGDDKVPFRHCTRPSCRQIHECMADYEADLTPQYRY